jgi:hypothetical protein
MGSLVEEFNLNLEAFGMGSYRSNRVDQLLRPAINIKFSQLFVRA